MVSAKASKVVPCPRCIGGKMHLDIDGMALSCLNCGHRQGGDEHEGIIISQSVRKLRYGLFGRKYLTSIGVFGKGKGDSNKYRRKGKVGLE